MTTVSNREDFGVRSIASAQGAYPIKLSNYAPSGTHRLLMLNRGMVANFFVVLAVAISMIVLFEPAPVDFLLLGLIILLPLLAQTQPGRASTFVCCLLVANVAFGLIAAPMADDMGEAIKHLFITIYLVVGGYFIAGWIADHPERRISLFMTAYIAACLLASALAIAGFFSLFPGAYDLFTNYGRAKGAFKDPNVLAAAIAPGFVWLCWTALTSPPARATRALAGATFIGFALLISFSRGAYFSILVSMLFMSVFLLASATTARRQVRLVCAALALAVALPMLVMTALQFESIGTLATERFRADQSYDSGPEGRFGGQAKAVDLLLENPWGIGVFSFKRYHDEEPHNVFLTQFMNGGWAGGFLYIIAIALTLAAGIRMSLRGGPLQVPQILMTSVFLGVVLQGVIIDSDHWRHFFLLQAGVLGLSDGARRMRAKAAAAARDDAANETLVEGRNSMVDGASLMGRIARHLPAARPIRGPIRGPVRNAPARNTPRGPAANPALQPFAPGILPMRASNRAKPGMPVHHVARPDPLQIRARLAARIDALGPLETASQRAISLTPHRLQARLKKPGPLEVAEAAASRETLRRKQQPLLDRLRKPSPIELARLSAFADNDPDPINPQKRPDIVA